MAKYFLNLTPFIIQPKLRDSEPKLIFVFNEIANSYSQNSFYLSSKTASSLLDPGLAE